VARLLRQQRDVMLGPIRSAGPSLAAALLAVPSAAPGQTVHYAYDAAGRLSVVANPHGDLAVYEYDAVGNLVSIKRVGVADVSDPVVIAHVTPGVAARGTVVSIFGKGFGASADANAVAFNGVPATVLTASPTRVTARVPANATTGPIRLTTSGGTATSKVFHVLSALTITPPTAVVAPHGSVRFLASGDGGQGVRWSVDRVAGGDARRGTISADGVYVAPETLPPGGVRVTATSVADSAVEATALVSVMAPRPLFVAAEPRVVGFPAPFLHVELTTTASVAVTANTAFAMAAPVALRIAPVILTVTPDAAARGETMRLVITGAGFEGATRLEFWTTAALDTAVTVNDLVISADGNEATASIAVSPDAALGPRIVRIITPAGSSGDAVSGENVFIVR
jgi:YD repeat-containing protein